MPDMIAQIDGTDAIASVGGPMSLWHQKGQSLDGNAQRSVELAMAAAHADIIVSKSPIYYDKGDGKMHPIKDTMAIVRDIDGHYLSTVGKDYAIVQYADAFAPVQELLDKHNLTIDVVGLQDEGRRAWMLTKLPSSFTVGNPRDKMDAYLSFHSSHDGSWAWSARPSFIREVCANTSAAVMRGHRKPWISMRHTSKINERKEEFKQLLDSTFKAIQESEKTFNDLFNMQLGPDDLKAFVAGILPDKNQDKGKDISPQCVTARAALMASIFGSPGASMAGVNVTDRACSAWAAYNGVTYFYDHAKAELAGRASAKDSAKDSALFGANWDQKMEALRMLMPAKVAA